MGFVSAPVWAHAQRWTFAKPLEGTTSSELNFVLGEVSLASDEFSARPRVEAGWRIAPQCGLGYTVAHTWEVM